MARWLSNLRGDLWGGLASAVLTIPLSIGFGLFAFGPLGPGFLSYGIIAGLYSAVIVPFVGLLLGHNSPSQLNREHPGVAIKLLTNLGRELSYRLRRANRTIYQLEI